jgi:hypothetical protein
MIRPVDYVTKARPQPIHAQLSDAAKPQSYNGNLLFDGPRAEEFLFDASFRISGFVPGKLIMTVMLQRLPL